LSWAGQTVREGHEGQSHIQQHESQHKRAKGTQPPLPTECISLTDATPQIFKIVLSKAFDLRCTIPEIEHVGEPLLLYQHIS
jgi:hypothetical protein